jgi:hypothetical protein
MVVLGSHIESPGAILNAVDEDNRQEDYTDKKENKIFLLYKEFRREQLQSHTKLTASSYMTKNLRISTYIRNPFLIYDVFISIGLSRKCILYHSAKYKVFQPQRRSRFFRCDES